MFALFASCSTQYSAALRCAAGKITIDPKAHLLVVRAAVLSMHADCNGDCFVDACLYGISKIYKYCSLFLSGTLFFKSPI